ACKRPTCGGPAPDASAAASPGWAARARRRRDRGSSRISIKSRSGRGLRHRGIAKQKPSSFGEAGATRRSLASVSRASAATNSSLEEIDMSQTTAAGTAQLSDRSTTTANLNTLLLACGVVASSLFMVVALVQSFTHPGFDL